MTDTTLSHYDAITERLFRAKGYASRVGNNATQQAWCNHNVMMIERELLGEIEFLKKHHDIDLSPRPLNPVLLEMSDDEVLRELGM